MSCLSFLEAHNIVDLKKATQEEIDKAFYDSISNDEYWENQNFKMLFNHRDQILAEGKIRYMRTFMDFGAPLDVNGIKYKEIGDRYTEQMKVITEY